MLATLTVVRYSPARAVLGALHIATQRPPLARTPGLRFAKLLGTGGGIGFSARPDPRTWALFAVWNSDDAWTRFRDTSAIMRQYRARGEEVFTLLLRPVAAHGSWDGQELFDAPFVAPLADHERVVVLTRASIRLTRALRFWSQVPAVDRTLRDNPDLLLTLGVGEVPWLRQATLSVWRSTESMRAWAYGTAHHREVVRRTRAEAWYAEELFVRFRLVGHEGVLFGVDPLALS